MPIRIKIPRPSGEPHPAMLAIRRFFALRRENLTDAVMNFVIWITVLIGLVVMSVTARVFDANCNIEVGLEFLRFVDLKLWLAQILGGSVAIGLIGIARSFFSRSEGAPIQQRALDEFVAVFRNFGSIFLISAILMLVTAFLATDKVTAEQSSSAGWNDLCVGAFNLICCALRRDRHGVSGGEHA